MVRPSHYLFVFTALFLAVGWWLSWGGLGNGEGAGDRTRNRGWNAVSGEIGGRVLDRLGWPIGNARIVHGEAETLTNADGRFQITSVGPGAVDLEITAPGYEGRWQRVHAAAGEPLVLVLEDELPWTTEEDRPDPVPAPTRWAGDGFVEDESGTPVSGALVTVVETGVSVRTDQVGHYVIPLPRTSASLIARDGRGLVARVDSLSLPRERAEGLTPLPKLEMVRGASVRGALRGPDGDPVPGALVLSGGKGLVRRAEADARGEFEIVGLFDGDYELTALPYAGSLGFRRTVVVDGDVELKELELLPEEELRIQIVANQGDPLPHAWVVAREGGLRVAHTRADETGWATLTGLAGGSRQFTVRSDGDFGLLPIVRRDGDRLIVAAGQCP